MPKTYTIASDSDGNIAFTVEAESAEAAAVAALGELGWSVKEAAPQERWR